MSIRTLVERASRGKSLKRNISIGGTKAPIIVSPDAQLKYLKPGSRSFDQDLIAISQRCLRPNDKVWDIGANVGVFTIAAAAYAQSVVAFEADIWLASLLRRTANLAENSDKSITIVPAAVSEKNGIAEFLIAKRGRASNALKESNGRSQMGGIRETVCVPTLNLDTLGEKFGTPDFIKIDVEGAEWLVVSGGTSLFQQTDPVVYIEIGDDQKEAIFDFFDGFGYTAFDHHGKKTSTKEETGENYFFARETQFSRFSDPR